MRGRANDSLGRNDSGHNPFPSGLAQPALRALAGAGFQNLEQLTKVSEAELSELHGMGPNSLKKLRQALADQGLRFASSPINKKAA